MALTFNIFDLGCIALIILSVFIGFSRGLVRELSTLANWVMSIWFGGSLYKVVANQLPDIIQPETLRFIVGFFIVAGSILITSTFLHAMINGIIAKTGLKGPDRILGLLFGLLRSVLFITLFIFLAKLATPLSQSNTWQSSRLIPYFESLEYWVQDLLPYEIE